MPNAMDQAQDNSLPLRLLDWYRAMGVDAACGDVAIDWPSRGAVRPGADFTVSGTPPVSLEPRVTSAPLPDRAAPPPKAQQAPAALAPRPAVPSVSRTFVAPSPDAAVQAARAAAQGAPSLEALRVALENFNGCGLKATAKSLCFYRGAAAARLMVVGEAPGREDDLAGRPFSGPAGDMLEKMLKAIGIDPETCHIATAVYWRPPGNRHPTPQELDVCQPFLQRQIELVAPRVLVLLGVAAARQVMDVSDGIMRVRGKWRDVEMGKHKLRAIASLSPGYLIKSPLAKQHAWRDLLAIKAVLAG